MSRAKLPLGHAHRQQDLSLRDDAVQPEGVEVLHEPVGAQDVVGQARGFEVALGLAQRRVVVGVGAHHRHQHHLAQALGARGVDQRHQQLVLVGVPGQRQQEGGIGAGQGLVQAASRDDVELHLVGARLVALRS